jgi:hypothetical protein
MKMYDDSLELLKSMSSEYSLMISLMMGNGETISATEESDISTVINNDIVIVDSTETIEEAVPITVKRKRAPKKA